MLLQLVQDLLNGLYIFFAFVLGIDKDVIKVYYYENVEFFYQNLVNIVLERNRYIGQIKKHHLVLEMAITSSESHFLFVFFPNPFSMVDISLIELEEMSSPTCEIQ